MLREGYSYGLPLAVVSAGSWVLGLWIPAVLFLCLTLFVLNFFRNPERNLPADPTAVVSPADGRVVQIAEDYWAERLVRRVSIFMSPFDVHVNRAPFAGTISEVVYQKGHFHMASAERASTENEQNTFTLQSEAGAIVVKQVAGLLARRIVFWKRVGDKLERGERVGLIKFGSRVDVLLDPEIEVCVRIGDRVRAGSSVLALAGKARPTPSSCRPGSDEATSSLPG